MVEIEIGLEKVAYTIRDGERLMIRHEKEEIHLTKEHSVAVRPVREVT
jgi:alpha,alpha-trehalose phosphorylase